MDPALRTPILLSIAASIATLVIKSVAYFVTDSVGLLSDAAESLVNLAASSFAYFCLWYSSRPADADHAYGHEKIEFFSSGLEGTLILVAAAGIGWLAIVRLVAPQPLEALTLGVALSFVASLVNLAVGRYLLRVGRERHSIILEADGHHLITDFLTSGGVLVGLVVALITGWHLLDPLLALAMALNITWTAFGLLHRSFDGLMDRALPEDEQNAVRAAIAAVMQTGTDFHAVRTRRAGARRFVDFHLLVPGDWPVRQGHTLAHRAEAAIRERIPEAEVVVHIEPIDDEGSFHDSEILRFEPQRGGS